MKLTQYGLIPKEPYKQRYCSKSSIPIECLKIVYFLYNDDEVIALHWIPSHCGIIGSETADILLKWDLSSTTSQK